MSEKHLMKTQETKRSGLMTMLLSLAAIVVAMAMTRLAVPFIARIGIDEEVGGFVVRSVIAVVAFVALGGASWLRPSGEAIRRTWSIARLMIVINVVLGAIMIASSLLMAEAEGGLAPGAAGRIAHSVLLYLLVGINEEVLFRGLAFCGLLAWMGRRKHGVAHAAFLSSFAFGFVHIMSEIDFSNLALTATGSLKVVETCMFALILCRGVFETRNLWGSITAHAFYDWVLVLATTIGNGEVTSAYATADPDMALKVCIAYAIVALVYLPSTIKAVKALRAAEPTNGPLMGA